MAELPSNMFERFDSVPVPNVNGELSGPDPRLHVGSASNLTDYRTVLAIVGMTDSEGEELKTIVLGEHDLSAETVCPRVDDFSALEKRGFDVIVASEGEIDFIKESGSADSILEGIVMHTVGEVSASLDIPEPNRI